MKHRKMSANGQWGGNTEKDKNDGTKDGQEAHAMTSMGGAKNEAMHRNHDLTSKGRGGDGKDDIGLPISSFVLECNWAIASHGAGALWKYGNHLRPAAEG